MRCAWKLFLLLPRMFLSRPPRGGLVLKTRLMERLILCHNGQWSDLVERSAVDAAQSGWNTAQVAHSGVCWTVSCQQDGKHLREQRWPLELRRLSTHFVSDDPEPRDPFPDLVANHVLDSPVSQDSDLFARTLRRSRRGAAAGPWGMTTEHSRPMLESGADTELLTTFVDTFAKGEERLSTPSAWCA